MADILEMLEILLQLHAVLGKRDRLVFHLEGSLIDPDRYLVMRQAPLAIQLPILEPDESMSIQLARVASREENAVERAVFYHRAFMPADDLRRTVTAILALLVRPVSLRIVVAHPFAVNLLHFLPTRRLMKCKVRHSSDNIDYVELILPLRNSSFLREPT